MNSSAFSTKPEQRKLAFSLLCCAFTILFGSTTVASAASDHAASGRYIVVLKSSIEHPGAVAETQTDQRDGDLGFVYRHALKGYSVEGLSGRDVDALLNDSRVKYVVLDRKVEAFAQTTPTGLSRIFAPENKAIDIDETDDIRINADVAVIDSGIDYTHPDLNVVGRTDCIPLGESGEAKCVASSGTDGNGHGTHVAGIVGALDNGFGTVGAAPGARLWAVRVLNNEGEGFSSWITAGIDWVAAHAGEIEVANMSLGGSNRDPAMELAIGAALDAGVVFTVSAGNDDLNADSKHPANDPDVITVSALNDTDGKPGGLGPACKTYGPDDTLASFSNWGSIIDIAAPGTCIYSTWKGGGYESHSGTSMAAPYVAGAAAILASNSNPNSKADVESIRQALLDGGSLNWKDSSGDAEREPLLYQGEAALPVEVATSEATNVGVESALLHGTVSARGSEPSYWFEYGTSTSYGSNVPASPQKLGVGAKYVKVSNSISAALQLDTTYHFRLAVQTKSGTVYGQDRTFTPRRWSVQTTPSGPSNTVQLQSVSCVSQSDCIAVGEEKIPVHLTEGPLEYTSLPVPLAYRWSGTEWVKLQVPHPNEAEEGRWSTFEDVSCGSATSCMAVGQNTEDKLGDEGYTPLIEYWDGSQWSQQSFPLPENLPHGYNGKGYVRAYLHGVSCISATSCTAVGEYVSSYNEFQEPTWKPLVETWNGGEWKIVAAPTPAGTDFSLGLNDISCISTVSCMVVGRADGEPFVLRNAGGAWSVQLSPNPAGSSNGLEDVSCISITACVAVGHRWFSPEKEWELGTETGFAVSWNGSSWVLAEAPSGPLASVSCTSASWCLGVGDSESGGLADIAERWTGSEWKAEIPATPIDAENIDMRLLGVSCVTGGCTSVGRYSFGGYFPVAERLNLSTAVTDAATGVKPSEAVLNGTVNPRGVETSYQFQFGATESYGFKVPGSPKSVGSGGKDVNVSEKVSNLTPGNTYHYRVVATNQYDTIVGADKTFTAPTQPVATTEMAASVVPGGATLNGTVNPKAASTTYQFEYGKTTSYGKSVPMPAKSVGSGLENVKVSEPISALEPNTTYHYRLVATNEAGTTKGEDKTFTTPRVVSGPPTHSFSFGSAGTGNGQFSSPRGIVIDSKGNTWVVDYKQFTPNLARVQKFNSKGEYVSQFGSYGTGNGQFKNPNGIAVDKEDNLYVADTYSHRVQKFNSKGEYLSQFTSVNMSEISGVTVNPQGDIWVTDAENGLLRFNSKGEFISKSGMGSGDGQLFEPKGLTADADGNIWVADTYNTRVQKFGSKGEFLAKFGSAGYGAGQFVETFGIAIDPRGTLWVGDYTQNRVQEIYPEGEYVTQFGATGTGAGQFKAPTWIAADAEGNLWVVDSQNKRVQVFKQPAPYSVETEAPISVKRTQATLRATVNPQGVATSYQFEYGTTPSFGKLAPASPKSIGSGSTGVKVSEALTGLSSGTTYYYRVVATTAAGATYGETRKFTTLPGPGGEAKWRVGGKTFAELGLKEEPFLTVGSFTIEIPGLQLAYKCTETGNGTLTATGPSVVHMTLKCEAPGVPACKMQPIKLDVDGKFKGTGSNLATIESTGCGLSSEITVLPNGTSSFDFGTEASLLNTTALHTTTYGSNAVYISGSTNWELIGSNAGKAFGVW